MVGMTIIKPLTQLREIVSKALSGQTKSSKSFRTFFIETMELYLTNKGRINFTTMAKLGKLCESRFRQNFKKSFDRLSFNKSFLEPMKRHRIAIAIVPCFISKSGKKTPGMDRFWSGCAAAMKKGLEILGISIVDADIKDAVFLKAEQPFTEKKRQTRKSFFCTDLKMSARDMFDLYRTRFQIEFAFRDAKQFTGLTHCQARNKEALAFAFNMSLSSINVARTYARQENINLSVGSTKTLLHNATMVD